MVCTRENAGDAEDRVSQVHSSLKYFISSSVVNDVLCRAVLLQIFRLLLNDSRGKPNKAILPAGPSNNPSGEKIGEFCRVIIQTSGRLKPASRMRVPHE